MFGDLSRLPFYDADLEAAGTPLAVSEFRAAVMAAEHVVVVTPEYDGTVPGLLANAVDWLSRPARESVLQAKPVTVLSASPTPYGGSRAAGHLREVLNRLGTTVRPTGLSVPGAPTPEGARARPQVVAELGELLSRRHAPSPRTQHGVSKLRHPASQARTAPRLSNPDRTPLVDGNVRSAGVPVGCRIRDGRRYGRINASKTPSWSDPWLRSVGVRWPGRRWSAPR